MALDTIPKQEGGKLKAVASGTLPNGKPVIVNADGTVSAAAVSSFSAATGTEASIYGGDCDDLRLVYAGPNKVVAFYRNPTNSYFGEAAVGTISGTSISFGTPVVFTSISGGASGGGCYDEVNDKVILAYKTGGGGNPDNGKAIVGTVSGTSISFGTEAQFNSGDTTSISATYDAASGKVVIAYADGGNSSYGTAIVGTVSGTSISFGTEVVFRSDSIGSVDSTFESVANKTVIVYSNNGGKIIVGTVSGTSISFGTEVQFNPSAADIGCDFDPVSGKVVIGYESPANGRDLAVQLGTVSGTSVTVNTYQAVQSGQEQFSQVRVVYNTAADKTVVFFRNSSAGTSFREVTVSGNSITTGDLTSIAGGSGTPDAVYDAGGKVSVLVFRESSVGKGIVRQTAYSATNLTSENYIGMSTGGAVADTGNATVDIVGTVNKEQSGLTAGQQYYVQTDGTIGTTPADPSVLAGTAVSATKMVVKS